MPSAHSAKVPQALVPGRTPVAFARHDGRKMPLTDEQLAALTPCEVSFRGLHGPAVYVCMDLLTLCRRLDAGGFSQGPVAQDL